MRIREGGRLEGMVTHPARKRKTSVGQAYKNKIFPVPAARSAPVAVAAINLDAQGSVPSCGSSG